MSRTRAILPSPVAVLAVGRVTARIGGQLWGVWSWIPVMLVC